MTRTVTAVAAEDAFVEPIQGVQQVLGITLGLICIASICQQWIRAHF